jgi:heme/copper-type cytochrome/quinol oxidase subunit 4
MWLGKRNFAYLRIAVFHISFIWLSSLFLPKLLNHRRLPARWASWVRLLVNFLNKNLYQQMLFFVLPVYYASATSWSRNIAFVALVGLSAVLATLDVVYDRHLSVKRNLTAVFFAFNLFILINVMLPVLWSISNTLTTRISAALAMMGFLTLYYPAAHSKARGAALAFVIGFSLLGLVELARPFIPPAPLRLASVEFGTGFQEESLQIESPVMQLDPVRSLRLYALTAIKAPLGLHERVRHRWYENGKLIFASPFYNLVGGREEGFRLWTSHSFDNISPGTELRLDLETEGGQLIGRAALQSVRSSPSQG